MRRVVRSLPALLFVLGLSGCPSLTDSLSPKAVALTPARSMVGTWTTPIAVPMNYQTDICTGARQTVGKATWTVTWIITELAGTSNGIDVEMRFSTSAWTSTPGICTNGWRFWVPEISPLFMQGTVSATRIQLRNTINSISFDGNLTTNNITGTFDLWDCQAYCSGEQSDPLKFILTKK